MRTTLAQKEGNRDIYTGEFVRNGIKNGYKGIVQTVHLKDVKDSSGNIVTDHLWFNMTKGFETLNLQAGDRVEFRGRVEKYVKGYKGYKEDVYKPLEEDFRLSRPTKVRKILTL